VGTQASAYQTKLHRAASPKELIKRLDLFHFRYGCLRSRNFTHIFLFNFIRRAKPEGPERLPPARQFTFLFCCSPIIIGEQQNKKVNVIPDVFHRLYREVLYSQNIVLFLVKYVIIFHTCDRHVAEFLFWEPRVNNL
jgi:hypothetical protein